MNNLFSKKSGQVMVESLVAVSLGLVGLMGILTLVSRSISLQIDLSQQFTANYLAAEGIELVRSGVDSFYSPAAPEPWTDAIAGFESGKFYQVSYDGSWEEASGENTAVLDPLSLKGGLYGYFEPGDGVAETIFKRRVEIVESDDVKIQVVSRVFWTSRGEEKSVSLEDVFYNWR